RSKLPATPPVQCQVARSPAGNIVPIAPAGPPAVAKPSWRRVYIYPCRQIDRERSIRGSQTASLAHQTSVDSSMPPILKNLSADIQPNIQKLWFFSTIKYYGASRFGR